MADIEIIRGDTYNMPITFKNDDGSVVNLTGTTIFFTVKPKGNSKSDDTDAVISKTITVHTDPTAGKSMLVLASSDTAIPNGEYAFDFQLKTLGGDIHSTAKGAFIVQNDITKRTT
jgi:C4-dicarboxylate transporter